MPVVEWAVSFSSGSQQVALRQFDVDFFRKKMELFHFFISSLQISNRKLAPN